MERYQHRQIGTLILLSLGMGIILVAVILLLETEATARIIAGSVLTVLVICAWLFWSLNVSLGDGELRVSFGPGLIHKRIELAEIRSAQQVRNRWFYGWGIRLTPHGWMYNVSGLDAVELEFDGGRKFRIGTDEPERLVQAIQDATGRRKTARSIVES